MEQTACRSFFRDQLREGKLIRSVSRTGSHWWFVEIETVV